MTLSIHKISKECFPINYIEQNSGEADSCSVVQEIPCNCGRLQFTIVFERAHQSTLSGTM